MCSVDIVMGWTCAHTHIVTTVRALLFACFKQYRTYTAHTKKKPLLLAKNEIIFLGKTSVNQNMS